MPDPRAGRAAADLDPTDPYAREAQTFPRLSTEMAERVGRYGADEALAAGEIVFRRGDRSVDFFLVLQGSVEIFERDDDGQPKVFTVHGERQFTGELDLFNDREILVSGRAGEATRVVRIRRADFRRLVQAEPDIGEIVMRAFILRRVGLIQHGQGGAVLIGPAHSADTLRIENFLTRNGYPHRTLDTERDPDADGFLQCFELSPDDLPVVVVPERHVAHRNPSLGELADALGLTEAVDATRVFDLAVVGAGPAGLAAAVYAASEGLKTVVIESMAPGGQAGTSSKIENYLGFPTGISGQALAGRAQVQAQKFGARLMVSRAATGIAGGDGTPFALALDGGGRLQARAVVVATGARYRRLGVDGEDGYAGQGLYYAATAMEADLCRGAAVAVVGGGNSAGQAAVFLSRSVEHVHVLVRGAGLAATMSDYLVQRIAQSARITLHAHTEIVALHGDRQLEAVTWRDRQSGAERREPLAAVFAMIGAEPNTGFVAECVDLDPQGFVRTGGAAGASVDSPYATSRAGIYAVGDVRSGSVKRVASGVGEGSVVIQAVHRFLNPAPAAEAGA